MNTSSGPAAHKISPSHLGRDAYVYIRQSTQTQVMMNTESLARQYELAGRAGHLGWHTAQIVTIDADLGQSGARSDERLGFKELVADVGLGKVGIVLGIEVSRLARNNADWYQLLDLCALTDTLIADTDGIYHPADFNDRLVLGLKGTMFGGRAAPDPLPAHPGTAAQGRQRRAEDPAAGRTGLRRGRPGGRVGGRGGPRGDRLHLPALHRARVGPAGDAVAAG